jgi:predicted Zn-dependent protease
MRKKIIMLLIAFSVLIVSTQAKAGIFGGKWASNPTYYISTSNVYYSEFVQAVSSWNSALSSVGASISIKSSTATSASFIPAAEFYGSTGWNGYCKPGPDPFSGTYTYVTYKLNRTYMDDFAPAKRKAICTHELGHALGLAHNSYTSPKTLMYEGGSGVYYDVWSISSPQSADIADLNSIY